MAVWWFLAAFALTIVLGASNPLSASPAEPAEAVEMFRRGCLDHLPDFAGSERAFKDLGFVPSRDVDDYDTLGREFRGSRVIAGLRLRTHDPVNVCFLIIHVPAEDDIAPLMADVIANLSLLSFRRERNESGTRESFTWNIGSLEAIVVFFKHWSQRSIFAIIGEKSE